MASKSKKTKNLNAPLTDEHCNIKSKVDRINDDTVSEIERKMYFYSQIENFKGDLDDLMMEFDRYVFGESDDSDFGSESDDNCEMNVQKRIGLKSFRYDGIIRLRLYVFKGLKKTICDFESLQSRILDVELKRWKKKLRLHGNKYKFSVLQNNLDHLKDDLIIIRKWCKNLMNVIFMLKRAIKTIEIHIKEIEYLPQFEETTLLSNINLKIEQSFNSLIKSTFIITRQPNQIINSGNLDPICINLLVGHYLGFVNDESFPNIEVSLVSGQYVADLLVNDNTDFDENVYCTSDKIKCSYKQENRFNSSTNLVDAKIYITEFDKNIVSTVNKPLYLLFESKFNVINSMSDNIKVLALSVPLVFNDNKYQEPYAKGKLAWYNAFGKPSSVIPDKVHWFQVVEMIEEMFRTETCQRPTKEDLQFIAKKAFRSFISNLQDFSTHSITWAQFYGESLPGKGFTFWEWLLAIIELSKKGPTDMKLVTFQPNLWTYMAFDSTMINEIMIDFKTLFPDHTSMDYTTNS